MRKILKGKLKLHRETLCTLGASKLAHVQGAYINITVTCYPCSGSCFATCQNTCFTCHSCVPIASCTYPCTDTGTLK